MYVVQKKAPIPKTFRPGLRRRRKYPFEQLGVGQFFFIPYRDKNTLVTYASIQGKKLGKKFATRLTTMVQQGESWRPCEANEKGAVQGIGVWRTK